jgi:hypothetical protein
MGCGGGDLPLEGNGTARRILDRLGELLKHGKRATSAPGIDLFQNGPLTLDEVPPQRLI